MTRRELFSIVIVAVFVVAIGSSRAPGATLHVPGDYVEIQGCTGAAVSGVDECVVAPGTYIEAINFNGKAITLRSAGGAAVTTIDGNGALHVVQCISGEGPDTVLEGFTITGGNAAGGLNSFPDNVGGGVFVDASSPTVRDCVFRGNTASFYGGGMYNRSSATTVANCRFDGNTASKKGGGVYNFASSVTLTGCVFDGNTANDGGGLCNANDSHATVTGCRFERNVAMANYGGGIFNIDSNSSISGCFFGSNIAQDGGGMQNTESNATVSACIFTCNTAQFGGGIDSFNRSAVTVINSFFFGNMAEFGGGIAHFGSEDATVVGSVFSGNAADQLGGAFFNDGTEPIITNSTFGWNTAGSGGGALSNTGRLSEVRTSILTNCVLWGNSPDEIWNASPLADNTMVGHSSVQFALPAGTIDGGGNIDADPLFVDADGPDDILGTEDDDLRLRSTSPCVDAGDNNAPGLSGIFTDLGGNNRFFDVVGVADTGSGLPPIVDMGAYEVQCGNGVVEPGEVCDDGAASPACDTDCTLPVCGDGLLNSAAGEECDDGNQASGDGCRPNCTSEGSAIPAVSAWGMAILALVLLAGSRIAFRRRMVPMRR